MIEIARPMKVASLTEAILTCERTTRRLLQKDENLIPR
jgi:hypothetical protein